MKGNHSAASRPREGNKPREKTGSDGKLLKLGWIFLGAMLILAAAAVFRLAGSKDPNAEPLPTVAPGPAGSAFVNPDHATLTTGEGQGGRSVKIRGVDCDYTPPEELVFGRLAHVDLSALGQAAADNARSCGWGEILWSETGDGALQLRSANPKVMSGDDFERQSAYLASDKPEAAARTFLENSRLASLLEPYGLHLDLTAENNGGEITFRGVGDAPQSRCSVKLTFLYTGSFSQAVIRAVYLADPVVTRDVLSLNRAMDHAVTWDSGSGEATRVSAVELRYVRGIPFYVLTCADGTVAFAPALSEETLSQAPGALESYRQMLAEGIQDNLVMPGAA